MTLLSRAGRQLFHAAVEYSWLLWQNSFACVHQHQQPLNTLLPQGLDYLHSKSIVHGDLKPDNMLLASDGRVKISDFGSARMVDHGHTTVRTMGTPAFLAPEMCEGQPYHGEVADIWALGICLYMFVYGMWHIT